MKYLISIIILVLFSCENSNKTIEGDLSFKLVTFIPENGFSLAKEITIKEILDSIDLNNVNDKNQKNFYKSLMILNNHKLLSLPNVRIKTNNGYKIVYLNKNEFNKIKKYNLKYLTKKKSKLKIKLKVQKLENDIYYSEKIIEFEEINGETFFEK